MENLAGVNLSVNLEIIPNEVSLTLMEETRVVTVLINNADVKQPR
ncbi:hypothetical protein LMG29542_05520 [Paraburkholderia humisilvae]|uniref:Uncharacterized protein n=1 Tax=Paraburkholderia humisilvae TaxID=627669 RepID=A0A6J5ELV3_9BURK|nr:hypothetical protein LMG29542_05520 [Paraburkholderia humisilvae]